MRRKRRGGGWRVGVREHPRASLGKGGIWSGSGALIAGCSRGKLFGVSLLVTLSELLPCMLIQPNTGFDV